MADKWMDERDRRQREQDWRRSEDFGGDQRRFEGGEERSFDESGEGARRSGPNRDRVFGERETGMSYGGEDSRVRSGGGAYGAVGSYGGGRGSAYRGQRAGQVASPASGQGAGQSGGRGGWQDRDYGGVSPAMQNDEYDLERSAERYQSSHGGGRGQQGGGRFYGDSGRERIYRQEYGQGGVEYGDAPRGYDAGRGQGGSGRVAPGGTGGYDYERGYGDAGRQRFGEGRGYEDRGQQFERAGHDAGDFFRRAGERVASWFGGDGGGEERRGERDFRGMGPKGYKRADERISDEAHERLTEDPWVDATNISISVSGGEITLSGTVENREAKHRAERCVEDLAGVNHVQNNLRIERGSVLTSPSRGFGDSVLEHQMRGETGAGEGLSGGTGGAGTNGSAGKSSTSTSASTDTGKSR